MNNFDLRKFLAENRKTVNENQDHSDEEELDLVPDLDKGGKNYSDNGYESYKLQVKAGYQIPEPYSLKNYKNAAELNREQAKDEGHRIGKYVVELEGLELEQFVNDWMKAWNEEISGGEKAQ